MRRFRFLESGAEFRYSLIFTFALACLCVLELILWPMRPDLTVLANSGSHATGIVSKIRIPPLPDSHEFTARPLFQRTRRAPMSAPEPVPDEYVEEEYIEATPTLNYVLSAVIIAEGQKIAYLSEAEGMALIPVRQGESIGGWWLAEVGQDYAVLEFDQERVRLELHPSDAELYEESDDEPLSLPIPSEQ